MDMVADMNALTTWERENTLVGLNAQIRDELVPKPFGQAGITATSVGVVAMTSTGIPTQLSKGTFLVKAAQIQNISVNAVTLGNDKNITPGNGFILNGASAVGNAGDTTTMTPQGSDEYVDLSGIWFVQIGSGNTLALLVFQ